MNLITKTFGELTTKELYEILKARSAVFVVEQSCVYQDIDGLDEKSLYVFYEDNGRLAAYFRVFVKEPSVVQMGRVLTADHGIGLGGKLLKAGIEEVRERFRPVKIYIEAQSYAVGFYAREGFRVTSEEFLEDGIPHVQMEKKM